MIQMPAPLVHICEKTEADLCLRAVQGYTTPDQDSLGFMHLSSVDLLLLPANKYYAGRSDLVLLLIDPLLLSAELRWEPGVPAEGDLLFPHLYGPLNADAVTQVIEFPPDAGGRFCLPDQLVGYCS